ncbi:MAG: hypothetical protein IJY42_05345 [Clostridia bacterium]|nr:hypothetical protein [Clostridia bacterium]
MESKEQTRRRLMEHSRQYPELQIQDLFKYLHQSSFGCEHLVSSLETAIDGIRKETERETPLAPSPIVPLDGPYSRVPLSYGLSAETLGKLFFASAKEEKARNRAFWEKLNVARELICERALPVSLSEWEAEVCRWQAAGYPAVRHSEHFRTRYRPSYRVIANCYLPFLPLFAALDQALQTGTVTLAIDGGSAGGKTTLSHRLEELYGCTVFHIDDFFLRPEQRTPRRLSEVGGNMDRERFLEEVLLPHRNGAPVTYRKFDCQTQALGDPVPIRSRKLTVIEGVYAMHPALAEHYDLSVFLEIAPELQVRRILHRNSAPMVKRFLEEWLPMEQAYFRTMQVKERCKLWISVSE